TNAGLTAARARGRKGGRPAVLDAGRRQRAVVLYHEGKLSPVEIARTVGCSRSTLYRALRAAPPQ
ncbi:MAG TPA: helix-turn-helix domain-containing protein, partial [Chloroflexota bacterium]